MTLRGPAFEEVPVRKRLGRALAEDALSDVTLPPWHDAGPPLAAPRGRNTTLLLRGGAESRPGGPAAADPAGSDALAPELTGA